MESLLIPDRQLQVMRVNAFTTVPFTGNPAGVVPEGDGLSDDLMLAIAGELNDISETVFICRPESSEADIKLRFFTSTTEVDLCGHATVSALFALGWLGRIQGRDETKWIVAETRVGKLRLGLEFKAGEPGWASMEQLAPEVHSAPGAALAADILGLPLSSLSESMDVGCASSGLWACFVPLKHISDLQRVEIDSERIELLWPENDDLTGVYPFVFIDKYQTQGRFFSPPKYGIVEDPVTGTASGALAAYLMSQGRLTAADQLTARQGFEMGRGGVVRVSCTENGNINIKGQAVPVWEGVLSSKLTARRLGLRP